MSDVSAELRACAEALTKIEGAILSLGPERTPERAAWLAIAFNAARAALALPAVQASLAGEGTPREDGEALAKAREIVETLIDQGWLMRSIREAYGDSGGPPAALIAAAFTAATRRT